MNDGGDDTRPETSPTTAWAAVTTHDVLTVDEVAGLLRVNRKTVYDAYHRGEIPGGRRIGRVIRFSKTAILRWLHDSTPRRPPR